MHVLITGASGYVGQHVLRALEGSDLEITALHSGRVPDFPAGVALDLSDEEAVGAFLRTATVDVCLHLAAVSSPRACQEDPERARRVNCPEAFLRGLSDAKVPLVALSTDQVYSGEPVMPSERSKEPNVPDLSFLEDETTRLAVEKAYLDHPETLYPPVYHLEDEQTDPANVYGETKVRMENFIAKNYEGHSLVLRSSLILGPPAPLGAGAHDTFAQFVGSRTEPTAFFVNEFRNVVAVSHVVNVLAWCATHTDRWSGHGIYNLGGPHRVDRYGLAVRGMESLRKRNRETSVQNAQPALQTNPLSPLDISMDSSKLQQLTGIPAGPADWDELFLECFPDT